jgi:DHA2 family methylenomycin A resistance protein-like MFS transporter
MTALANLVMYTTLVAMPVYLRDEHSLGDGAIGLLLFAMSATNVVAAPLGARIAITYGIRAGLILGSAVLVVSSLAVLAASLDGGALILIAPLAMMGIGMGLGGAAQQSSGLAAWPQSMAGSAAGTLSLMRYVGSVAGASLLAAILGSSPGGSDFTRLLAIVAGFAIINASLAFIRIEAQGDAEEAVVVPAAVRR